VVLETGELEVPVLVPGRVGELGAFGSRVKGGKSASKSLFASDELMPFDVWAAAALAKVTAVSTCVLEVGNGVDPVG